MIVPLMMAFDMFGSESTPEAETVTGGFYYAFDDYTRAVQNRRQQIEEAEEAIESLKPLEREIAELLQEQEAQDARRAELERLSSLVANFADRQAQDAFNDRVAAAYARYMAQQTMTALLQLERELGNQLEEEEYAVLQLLLDD